MKHHCCCCEGHCGRKAKAKPSLPTTPGSVVRSGDVEDGLFWVLEPDGCWYGRSYLTKAALAVGPAQFHEPEVIFDAGAS